MSKVFEEIGMIVGGLAMALLSGPVFSMLGNLMVCNTMIGVGLTSALMGTVGLLSPKPQQSPGLTPQGQLPIQTPNPVWQIVYGLFQFGGVNSFADGPFLDWVGTLISSPCENQYIQLVRTLACHQIAGFVSVILDGQTFSFGSDLVQLTSDNNLVTVANPTKGGTEKILVGPPGAWGFINPCNPWCGAIWFEFDCGNATQTAPPFPSLSAGFEFDVNGPVLIGSPLWTSACIQQGRAKVHITLHYEATNNETQGGPNGAPHPYPLGSGRVPTIEFKVLGRIIQDYRINTSWQAETDYSKYQYVIAGAEEDVFVQMNVSGTSAAGTQPAAFATTAWGLSFTDGTCLWLNVGPPSYALNAPNLGSVLLRGKTSLTYLNSPLSNKLQKNLLIADAWCGTLPYGPPGEGNGQVIEAPIGYLQYAAAPIVSGATEPTWSTTLGATTVDNGGAWICLGRSMYATVLPDDDGTQNQGGFSNPALVIADYLQTARNLFGLGATLTGDSIETIVAAANICDEPVAIEVFADATTLYERRFACNGVFESTSAYGDVLKSLALSMAGYVVPPGDCWRIYAGAYYPPLIALTDADARGAVKGDFRLSARETCNGVKGQFVPGFVPINPLGSLTSSPASAAWKKTDFPPVQRANYIAEDGGTILWLDISLDFTISLWMAQRIARITLERTRRQITLALPAKSTPLQLLAGDTVTYVHPRWETVTPPMPTTFFISHLAPRIEDTGGAPALGVDLILRQTDADVYSFAPPTSPTDYGDYSSYGQTGVGAGNVE